jgi:hypothetical protein
MSWDDGDEFREAEEKRKREAAFAAPTGSVDLLALQLAIECNLEKIERVLGPNYKLTLIGKYHGARPLHDADIILTKDTRENILSVLDRFCPPNNGTERGGGS